MNLLNFVTYMFDLLWSYVTNKYQYTPKKEISSIPNVINYLVQEIREIKCKYSNLRDKMYLQDEIFLNMELIFLYGNIILELSDTFDDDSKKNKCMEMFAIRFKQANNLFKRIKKGDNWCNELIDELNEIKYSYINTEITTLDIETFINKLNDVLNGLLIFKNFGKNSILIFADTINKLDQIIIYKLKIGLEGSKCKFKRQLFHKFKRLIQKYDDCFIELIIKICQKFKKIFPYGDLKFTAKVKNLDEQDFIPRDYEEEENYQNDQQSYFYDSSSAPHANKNTNYHSNNPNFTDYYFSQEYSNIYKDNMFTPEDPDYDPYKHYFNNKTEEYKEIKNYYANKKKNNSLEDDSFSYIFTFVFIIILIFLIAVVIRYFIKSKLG